MSNVYVYLARANTTLSVTLTALSCILAPVSMSVVIALALLTQATWLMAAVRIRTAGLTFTASGSRSR